MKRLQCIALLAGLLASTAAAMDNHHFYRASYFFGEPRLERNWLSTIEMYLAGGSTKKSRNTCGQTVPLFDLYGPANMLALGNGVPNKDITNPIDLALINLGKLSPSGSFGQLSLPGKFSLIELDINLVQNFTHGLFAQLYIPVRRFDIRGCAPIDISFSCSKKNCPTTCPISMTPEWQDFLNNFDAILTRYNISTAAIKRTCIGDVSALLGWTKNYQNTEILDFVDTTFKLGVLVNSAPAKNENLLYDIAPGYDKHIGFPILFDISLGAFDWFTVGFHTEVLPFLKRCKNIRMKTDCNQNGIIKLAQGVATVNKGPIWDLGMFVKADHLAHCFSLTFGYSFVTQEDDRVCPGNGGDSCIIFNPVVVNSDETFKGWQMHNLHFLAEYDFTKDCSAFGPRLGLLINAQVGGRKIFKNNMYGGYFGLDVAWNW